MHTKFQLYPKWGNAKKFIGKATEIRVYCNFTLGKEDETCEIKQKAVVEGIFGSGDNTNSKLESPPVSGLQENLNLMFSELQTGIFFSLLRPTFLTSTERKHFRLNINRNDTTKI